MRQPAEQQRECSAPVPFSTAWLNSKFCLPVRKSFFCVGVVCVCVWVCVCGCWVKGVSIGYRLGEFFILGGKLKVKILQYVQC